MKYESKNGCQFLGNLVLISIPTEQESQERAIEALIPPTQPIEFPAHGVRSLLQRIHLSCGSVITGAEVPTLPPVR